MKKTNVYMLIIGKIIEGIHQHIIMSLSHVFIGIINK
jgi:hypothetical protein